jgi:hypothetical protein
MGRMLDIARYYNDDSMPEKYQRSRRPVFSIMRSNESAAQRFFRSCPGLWNGNTHPVSRVTVGKTAGISLGFIAGNKKELNGFAVSLLMRDFEMPQSISQEKIRVFCKISKTTRA